jgi:hypothetical protein
LKKEKKRMLECSICKSETIEAVYSNNLVWCESCYHKSLRADDAERTDIPAIGDMSDAGMDGA